MVNWLLVGSLALLNTAAAFDHLPRHYSVDRLNENVDTLAWLDIKNEETFNFEINKSPLSLDKKKVIALDFVQKQMEKYGIPGILLSVVAHNKTVISQGLGTREYGNANAPVTSSTLFQIGSYTKTFIAVGIAKLVDEKRVSWTDSVQKHLPSFHLMDKYAEKYTTIGDLLSMNSVFGDHEGDIALYFGVHDSEKKLVEALSKYQTTRALRPGYAYSNINYEILGQVLEAVTKQPWHEYLRQAIWKPLGMNSTVARPQDAVNPEQSLSHSHFFCDKKVIGPFNLVNSTMAPANPRNDYLSAGSILSTADDLSKFTRFLLSNGHGILSSDVFTDMVTGQTAITSRQLLSKLPNVGYYVEPTGRALSNGYGFDFVGNFLFGHNGYSKDGDTAGFSSRNAFVPSKYIGVQLAVNGQTSGGQTSARVIPDLLRSYVMGVFLDVPVSQLDRQFQTAVDSLNKLPRQPCDPHFFSGQPLDIPGVVIPQDVKTKLVGEYVSTESPGYYGKLTLSLDNSTSNDLMLQYGVYTRRLIATKDPHTFIWDLEFGISLIPLSVMNLDSDHPTLIFLEALNFVPV